jgi:putative FmdB family regulatory protein
MLHHVAWHSPSWSARAAEPVRSPVPTYQYACTECGEPLEVVQSFSDDSPTECPSCGGRLRKLFNAVGIVFKGSGFYRTDSRSGAADSSSTAGTGDKPGKDTAADKPAAPAAGAKPAKDPAPSGSAAAAKPTPSGSGSSAA